MKDFKKSLVWPRAHEFVQAVYSISTGFPSQERYGLTSQLRRAAASVPTNIAEGCGRQGDAELRGFCQIAMGSASEVEYHLLPAQNLNFVESLDHHKLNDQLIELKRMLNSFLQKQSAKC